MITTTCHERSQQPSIHHILFISSRMMPMASNTQSAMLSWTRTEQHGFEGKECVTSGVVVGAEDVGDAVGKYAKQTDAI